MICRPTAEGKDCAGDAFEEQLCNKQVTSLLYDLTFCLYLPILPLKSITRQ